MARFVIWSPGYSDRSAGICALHRLCHWLTVLGHDASLALASNGLNPDWETRQWEGGIAHDTVAVYPEIVSGNPFNAPRIARYALSHPGWHYFNSPARFDPFDAAFYYAERFRPATVVAAAWREVHRLFVNVYDPAMFFDWKGARPRDMFYVGRGGATYEAHKDKVDLSNAEMFGSNLQTRYDVGKRLRRVRRFFVFDQVSAILAESMLCGCETYFIAEDGSVTQCRREGVENMGVFEDPQAFYRPNVDIEKFVEIFG